VLKRQLLPAGLRFDCRRALPRWECVCRRRRRPRAMQLRARILLSTGQHFGYRRAVPCRRVLCGWHRGGSAVHRHGPRSILPCEWLERRWVALPRVVLVRGRQGSTSAVQRCCWDVVCGGQQRASTVHAWLLWARGGCIQRGDVRGPVLLCERVLLRRWEHERVRYRVPHRVRVCGWDGRTDALHKRGLLLRWWRGERNRVNVSSGALRNLGRCGCVRV
jgi:hypothetical protein